LVGRSQSGTLLEGSYFANNDFWQLISKQKHLGARKAGKDYNHCRKQEWVW